MFMCVIHGDLFPFAADLVKHWSIRGTLSIRATNMEHAVLRVAMD